MAAFQFPDPAVQTTVINPITGSTYQWKEPPGKWVVTVKMRDVGDIIWEGDKGPDPVGDYKLWYHTDELELYFYYCDINDKCDWVPTSAPITMLEDLDTSLAQVKADVVAANVVINEHENRLDSIIYFGPTPPPILPDNVYTDSDGNVTTEQNEVNYKFWLNTTDNQLSILRIDSDASSGYSYAKVSSNPDLQEVLDNGAVANKGMILRTSDPSIPGSSEYDAIEFVPAAARIAISAEDDAGWKPTLELIELVPQNAGATRKAQIELDDNRLDINVESVEDEIHFRFNDIDKLVLKELGGPSELKGKLVVEPGNSGNEVITYEQLANLAGEIDEIKEEKEKGPWKAELPSAGSDGGRDVLIDAPTFPEAQGGSNMMILNESGGEDGFGQLGILIDPNNQDDENQALQRWLKDAATECTKDPDAFKDKYSFYCHQAEEKGFAVRNQPIHSIEDPSLTTFKINFYGKPSVPAKQDDVVGVEFFEEAAEGHRPAAGKFFMEVYQDESAQQEACAQAYTKCVEDAGDDAIANSNCLRDFDACKGAARDGFVPTADFGKATALVFNRTDASSLGVTHSFDEVRIGDSINVTDSTTKHFILAEIAAIQQQGDHIRFTVDTLSSSGGIVDGEKCDVEFFNFSFTPEAPDLDNYVKKNGDKMTGALETTSQIMILPDGYGARGVNNMLVVNQRNAPEGSIARFQQQSKDVFKIEHSKNTSVCNNKLVNLAAPEDDKDATNKKWVEENTVGAWQPGIKISFKDGVYFIEGA